MVTFASIPWGGLLLGVLGYFFLGALWFTPLFGKLYDKAIGFDRSTQKKWPTIYYVGPLLGCIVGTIAMAVLSQIVEPESLSHAIILGLIVGIGFALPISIVNAIIPKMVHPILFGCITGIYHTVGLTLVSMTLFYF